MLQMIGETVMDLSAPCEAGEQAQAEQRSACGEALDAEFMHRIIYFHPFHISFSL